MHSTVMKHWVVGLAVVAIGAGGSSAYAQRSFEPPRLQDGRPDLQGVWDFRTLTPLERSEDLADNGGIPFTQVPTTGCGGVSSSDHGNP